MTTYRAHTCLPPNKVGAGRPPGCVHSRALYDGICSCGNMCGVLTSVGPLYCNLRRFTADKKCRVPCAPHALRLGSSFLCCCGTTEANTNCRAEIADVEVGRQRDRSNSLVCGLRSARGIGIMRVRGEEPRVGRPCGGETICD